VEITRLSVRRRSPKPKRGDWRSRGLVTAVAVADTTSATRASKIIIVAEMHCSWTQSSSSKGSYKALIGFAPYPLPPYSLRPQPAQAPSPLPPLYPLAGVESGP